MPRSYLPLLLLPSIFFGGCLCSNVLVIGVMVRIHLKPNCTQIDVNSVKQLESVYWMIDIFHKVSNQNLTIEIDSRDICKKYSVLPTTLDLIHTYKNGPKKLIGIVTSSSSSEAMEISKFINLLPAQDHIIQVGSTETAYGLNDRLYYRNMFNILPDDRVQMKMICDVLKQIKWNYIALLYEDCLYGRQGAELFASCAKEANIHIGIKLQINEDNLNILRYDVKEISGAVIIAQRSTVKWVLEKDRFGRKMSFIISESVYIEQGLSGLYSYGAFLVVQKPNSENEQFDNHWRYLFNKTTGNTSKYFREMVEEISQCSFTDANNSCDMEKALGMVDSKTAIFDITESIVTSAYAIIQVFERILKKRPCLSSDCPWIFEEALKEFRNPIDFTFLKHRLGYERMNFINAFGRNGRLIYPPNRVLYKLFYRKKEGLFSDFSFTAAGRYTSSGLNLDRTTFPGYDGNTEFPIKSITCQPNSYCKKHEKTPNYIYKEGDIMLIGIVPIHDRHISDLFTCGSIRSISGVSLAEAMLFAVEDLNERNTYKYIFPGKKIGILIIDSCNSDIHIMKTIFGLRKNDPAVCNKNLNCSQILNETIVYIGPLSSQTSHSVSRIMTYQRTVDISFGSTSETLSDRKAYPNFMRVCTADDQQTKAIIDLLVKFDWKYTSVIYSNELYGISFKNSFIRLSEQHNICVIREIPYDAKADVKDILTRIRQRPEARVVVLYLRSNQAQTFLPKFVKFAEKDEFIFIGSEAWADKIQLGNTAKNIHGSLTLGINVPENAEFNQYKKDRIIREENSNMWLMNYIEKKCYLPLSLDKRSRNQCPPDYTLKDADIKSVWIPFVIDAVTAAAVGLNRSISQICQNGLVCPELFERTEELIENIKNVQLRNTRVFDDNGDGTSGYDIFRLEIDGTYKKIGGWSKINSLSLNKDFRQPTWKTKCPNSKRCSECIRPTLEVITAPKGTRSYVAVIVIFFILILVIIAISVMFYRTFCRKKHKDNYSTVVGKRSAADGVEVGQTQKDIKLHSEPELPERETPA